MEVSKLSFSQEYGSKLKEGYVMVKHLTRIPRDNADTGCITCGFFDCCNNSWQKVTGFCGFKILIHFCTKSQCIDRSWLLRGDNLLAGLGCTETRVLGLTGRPFWYRTLRYKCIWCSTSLKWRRKRASMFGRWDKRPESVTLCI